MQDQELYDNCLDSIIRKEIHKLENMKGGFDIVKGITSLFPSTEFHLYDVGYDQKFRKDSFCGPGTQLNKRIEGLKENGSYTRVLTPPNNKLDSYCMKHDIAYHVHKDKEGRHRADEKLINQANEIILDPETSFTQRMNARLTKNILKTKLSFGLGKIDNEIYGACLDCMIHDEINKCTDKCTDKGGRVPYCGIKKIPKGKKRGTMRECIQKGEVRYWGLNVVDRKIIHAVKNMNVNKEKVIRLRGTRNGMLTKKKRLIQDIIREKNEKKKNELKQKAKDLIKEINNISEKIKEIGGDIRRQDKTIIKVKKEIKFDKAKFGNVINKIEDNIKKQEKLEKIEDKKFNQIKKEFEKSKKILSQRNIITKNLDSIIDSLDRQIKDEEELIKITNENFNMILDEFDKIKDIKREDIKKEFNFILTFNQKTMNAVKKFVADFDKYGEFKKYLIKQKKELKKNPDVTLRNANSVIDVFTYMRRQGINKWPAKEDILLNIDIDDLKDIVRKKKAIPRKKKAITRKKKAIPRKKKAIPRKKKKVIDKLFNELYEKFKDPLKLVKKADNVTFDRYYPDAEDAILDIHKFGDIEEFDEDVHISEIADDLLAYDVIGIPKDVRIIEALNLNIDEIGKYGKYSKKPNIKIVNMLKDLQLKYYEELDEETKDNFRGILYSLVWEETMGVNKKLFKL